MSKSIFQVRVYTLISIVLLVSAGFVIYALISSADRHGQDELSISKNSNTSPEENYRLDTSSVKGEHELRSSNGAEKQLFETNNRSIDDVEYYCGLFEGTVLRECLDVLDEYFAAKPSSWGDDVYGDYFEDPVTLRKATVEFFQKEECLITFGPVNASLAEECNVEQVSQYFHFMRMCPRREIEDRNDNSHFNTETYLSDLSIVPGYTGEWRATQQSIRETRDGIRERYYLEGWLRIQCNQFSVETAFLDLVHVDTSFLEEYSQLDRERADEFGSDAFWDMASAHDKAHRDILLPSLARLGVKSLIDIYNGFNDDEYMDSLLDYHPLYVHDIGCKSFDAADEDRLKSCILAHYWSSASEEPQDIRQDYVRRYLFASSFEIDKVLHELGEQLSEEFVNKVRVVDVQNAMQSLQDSSTSLPNDAW